MKGFKKSLLAAQLAHFVLPLVLFCVFFADIEAAVKYVTPSGAGTKDGSSWENACGNAEFITNLPLASSGDEFWIAAGVYKPTMNTTDRTAAFQLKDGVALYGGFAGIETLLTQRNWVANVTILSGDIDSNDSQTPVITDIATVTGNTSNSHNVVKGTTGATLDGFTITAGYADNGSSYPYYMGGGMFNGSSSPMVTHCTFAGNHAMQGGGMFNIYSSNPTVTGCTFTGNSASVIGGGMCNDSSMSPMVTNCTFSGNKAAVNGGGIFNKSGSGATVTHCTISGNSANSGGGGIYNSSGSSVTVTHCTFSSNSVGNGGGGMWNNGSSPIVTNCTFSGNAAVNEGGGMYNDASSSPAVTNCTFSGNTATTGLGVYTNSGSPVLTNCILWDAATPEISGGTPTVTYCVVQGGFSGTGNIGTNPDLGPLAANGGATQTHALPAGSSALDAGTGTGAPATDQRGVSRPQGAGIDIGSFERSPVYWHVTPSGAGTKNGTSWENAFGNAEFITHLPLASIGTEFWLAAGLYKPTMNAVDRDATFQLKDGVALYGGFVGGESARDQRDPAANLTVLSGDIDSNDSQTPVITDLTTVTGNASNSEHVVTGANGATLDGFTVTAGYAQESGYGGGIYIHFSSPTLLDCTFSGNSARHTGGGMFNDHGSPTLTRCAFSGNRANYGGGMRSDFSNLTATDCTFSGNLAAVYGGGMFNDSGNPMVKNCTFSGNTATNNGGGMYSGGGSPTLANCTFSGNTTDLGGGMYNINGSPVLTNCTFSGNTAASNGNGLYHHGIGNLTVTNCILWDAATPEISGGTPTVTYCVVQGGFSGTGNIGTNPDLGPLADNGGSTQTHALPAGSSALDAGTATGAPATDQRGVSRPQGAGIDIGAFELEAYQVTFTAGFGGTLSGATPQTVFRGGSSSPVTANALAGYGFVNWTGSLTSTDNPLTISNVTADMTVTANFALSSLIVSGTVLFNSSPLSSVVMSGLPGNPVTDGSGFYTSAVDYDWSGTVTPTLAGYLFTPASRSYSNVTSDQTDQDYSAVLAPALQLTAPNGWEHWTLGSTKTITWNAINYTGTVRLVLFKNGVRFGNIVANVPASAGSYSWTVGQTYDSGMAPEGSDYRLYLRSTDGTIIDPSDYRLGLIDPAQLQLTSPNGGENWELGTTQNITWNANGYAGTVRLILFQKAAKIGQIVGSLPADQGSYAWTVGTHQAGVAPAGMLYSIRVLAGDGSQDDYSDGPLTLVENDALIVDHQHTTLSTIPSQWLDQASRETLLVLSAGGNDAMTLGLRLLGDRDSRLATAGSSNSLGLALNEGSWLPQGAALDLQEWQWAIEKAILESQATVAIARPDEQALLAGKLNAESYLQVMSELANRLPGIKLVCATVGMDEPNDILAKFNRQVRESVLRNRGILLDVADIESWSGGEQKLVKEVPVRHPANRMSQGMQSQGNLADQGVAMWWLLARLSGWPGPEPEMAE